MQCSLLGAGPEWKTWDPCWFYLLLWTSHLNLSELESSLTLNWGAICIGCSVPFHGHSRIPRSLSSSWDSCLGTMERAGSFLVGGSKASSNAIPKKAFWHLFDALTSELHKDLKGRIWLYLCSHNLIKVRLQIHWLLPCCFFLQNQHPHSFCSSVN